MRSTILGLCIASLLSIAPVAEASAAERVGVIVRTKTLAQAAEAWRTYREGQGWTIRLVEAEEGIEPTALRERIRAALASAPDATTAILLLGDVGPGGIPTFYFEQPEPALVSGGEPRFASDHPYALLVEERESSAVALGRVSVSTDAEARAVLTKIERYEDAAPLGAWRHRINYVAGEGHFGPLDRLLETLFVRFVDELLPEAFDITMTYAKSDSPWCPPPSAVETTTLSRMTEGALLFNYVGHGHADGVDSLRLGERRLPILRGSSIARLPECAAGAPIALMSCCSTGWFDRPATKENERDCLAETMLAAPNGPVAIVAGTRPTHPYGNAAMQKEFTRTLIAHADRPLGEIDRLARRELLVLDAADRQLDAIARPVALLTKWKLSLAELRLMHVRMYTLFGDPMMRVAAPGVAVEGLKLDGTTLRGRLPGMASGEVEVVIESDRSGHGRNTLTAAVDGDDLEKRAAHNYPLANDRVLWRGRSAVQAPASDQPAGGSPATFAIELPTPLPAGSAIVRIYAVGRGGGGGAFEAIGGMRLAPPASTSTSSSTHTESPTSPPPAGAGASSQSTEPSGRPAAVD